MKKLHGLFLIGIVVVSFMSCTKFKGNQEIPAYMCIKSWDFATDYTREGAATEAITDAWIYVDGNVHGCYEIRPKVSVKENPVTHQFDTIIDESVTFPILSKGKHDVILYPGVKLNGIASTRIQYPFYKPFKINDYEFVPGKIDTIVPSTEYYDVDEGFMHFKLMEDFESPQLKFIKTNNSDTTIVKASRLTDPNAWTGDLAHSVYSGHVWLGDSTKYFCIATDPIYGLPNQGDYILLEIDYKCDVEFEIGLFAKTKNGIETFELIYLRPTSEWKKTYVNIGPTVTNNQTASYFKLFLAGSILDGETADFYFDNIKLIYRD